MDPSKIWTLAIAIGIVLIISGFASLFIGFENSRTIEDERTIESMHAYSFVFHVSAGKEFHCDYNLSGGYMAVVITSSEGHLDVIETGYPSEENLFLEIDDATAGEIVWIPQKTDTYYVIFLPHISNPAQLSVSISYTGSLPQMMLLGIIIIIIGIAISVVSFFFKIRKKVEVRVPPNEPKPPIQ